MTNQEYPQKYIKPWADRYHPEVYKDARFKKAVPPIRVRIGQGNLIQPNT